MEPIRAGCCDLTLREWLALYAGRYGRALVTVLLVGWVMLMVLFRPWGLSFTTAVTASLLVMLAELVIISVGVWFQYRRSARSTAEHQPYWLIDDRFLTRYVKDGSHSAAAWEQLDSVKRLPQGFVLTFKGGAYHVLTPRAFAAAEDAKRFEILLDLKRCRAPGAAVQQRHRAS